MKTFYIQKFIVENFWFSRSYTITILKFNGVNSKLVKKVTENKKIFVTFLYKKYELVKLRKVFYVLVKKYTDKKLRKLVSAWNYFKKVIFW